MADVLGISPTKTQKTREKGEEIGDVDLAPRVEGVRLATGVKFIAVDLNWVVLISNLATDYAIHASTRFAAKFSLILVPSL